MPAIPVNSLLNTCSLLGTALSVVCCTMREIQEMPTESLACQDRYSDYTFPHKSQGLEEARVSVGNIIRMPIPVNANTEHM